MNQKQKVREIIQERLRIGKPIDNILLSLAERAPSTLIDIAIGLNPIGGEKITLALIPLLEQIEERIGNFQITELQFYQRLADNSEGAASELLEEIIARHYQQEWLIDISQQVEGLMAGYLHLSYIKDEDFFEEFCCKYAQKGMRRSLVSLASELGRIEPVLALLTDGNVEVGLEAAALALESNPRCGVIEHMAAILGPDIDLQLSSMIKKIQDPGVAKHIAELVHWYPRAKKSLQDLKRR
ncbi:MAG: hypothetical protein VX278_20815 [Myxococcota bacterium]|nr:hypothetical protein [Myxococcota bacterium]